MKHECIIVGLARDCCGGINVLCRGGSAWDEQWDEYILIKKGGFTSIHLPFFNHRIWLCQSLFEIQ